MSKPPAEPLDRTVLLGAALSLGLRLRNWSFGANDHCFAVYCNLDSYVGTVEGTGGRLITMGATIADRKTLAALIDEYTKRMHQTNAAASPTNER